LAFSRKWIEAEEIPTASHSHSPCLVMVNVWCPFLCPPDEPECHTVILSGLRTSATLPGSITDAMKFSSFHIPIYVSA